MEGTSRAKKAEAPDGGASFVEDATSQGRPGGTDWRDDTRRDETKKGNSNPEYG